MDDDDEFRDLYTDVLRPFSGAPPSISGATSANPSPDLNLQSDDEDILYGAPDPKFTFHSKPSNQTLVLEPVKVKEERVVDEITAAVPNLIREEEKGEEVARVSVKLEETRVLNTKNIDEVRVSEDWEEKPRIGDSKDVDVVETRFSEDKGGSFLEEDVQGRLEIEDMDSEPMIPGLSSGPFRGFDAEDNEDDSMMRRTESGGGDVDGDEDGGGDDWDSDSEDDLQIVLNDKSGPIGMDGNGGMGSEDGDGENLVIVADGDQPHQPIDEQEWGEDIGQAGDGERKEVGDSAKVNGGAVNAVSARIGYSGHGYLPHHHSQFKYVRPGAAVVPGGSIVGPGGAPGQVRPLVGMGPMAGRGRGDWRPIGVKPGLTMQRPFHSGFGLPVWANNSAGRGFGSGLDFTLPSHKTVFDIDIDSFEEKPWRHPGVDVSDFFNFGLDEDNWKDYCKQLEQLRLEATMQSKIRVYESGRSEQDYDPDLPPELAAAAGMHDASAENVQLGKIDGGQADLMGQGRGAARVRPPIPTGRAIQVEGGFGERLPSIDTRPPRVRDCDSIIEIVLQGSMDDDDDDPVAGNDDAELPENDLLRDDLKKGGAGEDSGPTEYVDRSPQTYDGRKGEVVGKREPFIPNDIHEGDAVLPFPSESPTKYNSDYKGRAPSYRGGTAPHERRWPRGSSRDRYPHPLADNDNDVTACQSAQEEQILHSQREKSGESIDGEQDPDTSSLAAVEAATETSVEHTANVQNELDLDDSSALVEGNEKAIDTTIPTKTVGDGSPVHSIKKQKLSSRVEPAVQDVGSGDDLKATRSSDNSKARSGSSRDNQKRRDAGEEEVVQEGRSRRMGDMKRRRDEDGHSFQRKDDYNRDGRHELNRNRMFVKGKEDAHLTYPYRERDLSSTHVSRAKPGDIERSRERASSVGARLRRDDDTHGRRAKEEEIKKRECVEEMVPRHRSKVHEIEKSEKDDHFHSRKRLENGDWRGHHDKEVGSRQRERDDVLMSRHENFEDSHTKRRKDEENQRREQSEKEILHGYRAREDTSRRKRERDDSLEQRRREDQARVREKPDDSHSVRHREENWRQREKDDMRLKQPHEDMPSTREREGRGTTSVTRSGRDSEDKSWVGSTRAKDETKGLGSDKEYPFKDKRRQNEPSKRSDRAEDESFSHRRGRDNVYTRENQFGYEDRNPRHERSSTHNDRSLTASDTQLMHKERHKDNRRNKESEGGDQDTLGSSKRKQEDHRSEKVNMKVASDQVSGRLPTSGPSNARDPGQLRLSSSSAHSKKNSRETDALQQRHSSRKHREDAPSDEENDSRRGRSKLERWTSHKDRDDSMKNLPASSSKVKEMSRNNTDPFIVASEQSNEPSMIVESDEGPHPTGEDRNVFDLEMKDVDGELTAGSKPAESDKVGDDRHLDTVAKLKKRSERFKTPMQSEKDAPTNKKMENEALASSTQSETAADAEVKPERPARKRRWISS